MRQIDGSVKGKEVFIQNWLEERDRSELDS